MNRVTPPESMPGGCTGSMGVPEEGTGSDRYGAGSDCLEALGELPDEDKEFSRLVALGEDGVEDASVPLKAGSCFQEICGLGGPGCTVGT